MKKWLHIVPVAVLMLGPLKGSSQYISEVFEYMPAPGQFTNEAPWGIPSSAFSIAGDVNGSLCLGSYGGYVVFGFDHPVENHPDNPYGVDFTIFGNPLTHWSEPGIVWVSEDSNGNGIPDDDWFELAGSDYYFSTSGRDYRVTYRNPGDTVASNVPWSDNLGNTGAVIANDVHDQSYYPVVDSFPNIPSDQYTLKGSAIQAVLNPHDFLGISSIRRAFGYADNQVRGVTPYTLPDNPYTRDVEQSGGDAFDISWAVDTTGNYIDLEKIHFVKVQNGVQSPGGWLGELSTEITGAVDVQVQGTVSGTLDMIVIKELPQELEVGEYQIEAFVFHQGRLQPERTIEWTSNLAEVWVNEDLLLTVQQPGELILTASLAGNPEVKAGITTSIISSKTSVSKSPEAFASLSLYPNPAKDYIWISVKQESQVFIYDMTGKRLFHIYPYYPGNAIDLSELPQGTYLIEIHGNHRIDRLKLLKD